jgi:TRAP-type C4-dicarboxylate transport system permease small subunit
VVDRIEALWARVLQAVALLNGLVILLLAMMITTDVVFRWLAGRPIIGVFEISQILFIPVIFWVLGLVIFTNRQVRLDIVSARARGRLAVGLRVLDQVLGLLFFGVLLWTGGTDWLEAIERNYVGRGMLEIPQAVPLGFLVFGSLLIVATLVIMLVRSIGCLITGDPVRNQ